MMQESFSGTITRHACGCLRAWKFTTSGPGEEVLDALHSGMIDAFGYHRDEGACRGK